MYESLNEHNRAILVREMEYWGFDEDLSSKVLALLDKTDFFVAPASTRYHGSYPGGLFEHSLAMAQLLMSWTKKDLLSWERHESPLLVGILHDFCKAGKYLPEPFAEDAPGYTYNPDAISYGLHGAESAIRVALEVPITEEEAMCIRWHMGAYEGKEAWDSWDRAIHQYANVLWTHHADMVVSKVLEV